MSGHLVCPDLERYRELASGRLPVNDKDALLTHLESCGACAQMLETASDRLTLGELLQGARSFFENKPRVEVIGLVERLSKLNPLAAPILHAQAQTGPPSGSVTFLCSGCGKHLKVKQDLAGKQVRCANCQRVVRVPDPEMPTCALAADHSKELSRSDAATLAPSAPLSATDAGSSGARRPDPIGDTIGLHGVADPELTEFLAPPQAPDELGRLGSYRVLAILGTGGMGVVYKAEDPQLKRLVALKAMLPNLGASSSARKRFLREAQSAAAIKHDHIVSVYQVGEERGVPYLAMEFLSGEPLDERLKRDGRLPLNEILRIGCEMAEGLAAAHEAGLIHRDIKPANVWLEGKKARVKILDFGLARAAAEEQHLTHSGAIVGTPAYMAPEQAQGKTVDRRCDLFSLGVVLYRLGTGKMPFHGTDTVSMLVAVSTQEPPAPAKLNAELPPALSDLVMKLLEKDPAKRIGSAAEVAQKLMDLAQHDGQTPGERIRASLATQKADTIAIEDAAAPMSRPLPAPRRPKRALLGVALAAAILCVLSMGGAAVYQLLFRTDNGTLVVEVEGKDADVRFKDGKLQIYDAEGKRLLYSLTASDKNKALPLGKYRIMVEGAEGVKLDTDVFEMTQKGWKVRVRMAPDALVAKKGPAVVPLSKDFTNNLGMEFVLVPKGKSWLGGGAGREGDRQVEIAHDFYMGKYPLTQEEWTKVMKSNPSAFSRDGVSKNQVQDIDDAVLKRFPVENMTWAEAQAFLKVLNAREKDAAWRYRLPTDTEWEYACRGGPMADKADSAFDYYFDKPTNELLPGMANVDRVLGRPCKVGSYKPTKLGLYDMYGNMGQMCDYGSGGIWVSRAAGWVFDAGECRAAVRRGGWATHRAADLGMRLVRIQVDADTVAGAPVAREPVEASKFTNDLGMEFAKVPRGKAWLGSIDGRPGDTLADFKEDFFLGAYEVAQEEWEKVMGAGTNPSYFSRKGKDSDVVKGVSDADLKRFPVEGVSWNDCQDFISRLNDKLRDKPNESGWVYRLPTQLEWEYACRGGPMTSKGDGVFDYYGKEQTNNLAPQQANFADGIGLNRTRRTGDFSPNRLGLHDMHGNVWEWCADTVGDGRSELRVVRGGAFDMLAENCRAGTPHVNAPTYVFHSDGLRVARVRAPAAPPPPVAEKGVLDYAEIHDADEKRFDAWIAQMQQDGLMPVSLSIQVVKDAPRYTAVAVKQEKKRLWELGRATFGTQGNHIGAMWEKNYGAVIQNTYTQGGKLRMAALWIWNLPRNAMWTGDLPIIESKIAEDVADKNRPIHRSASDHGGIIRYSIVLGPDDGTPMRDVFNLQLDTCKTLIEKHRADGWRPTNLYTYGSGAKLLFGVTLVQEKARLDWDISWSLTPAAYEAALIARKKQGFRPHASIGHDDDAGALRFSVVWVRYRSAGASAPLVPQIKPVAEPGIHDFAEIHDADEQRFDAWIAQMKKDGLRPVRLSVQTVKNAPRYTAVAVKDDRNWPWEFSRVDESVAGHADEHWNRKFEAVAHAYYRDLGIKREAFLWAKDDSLDNEGYWVGDAPFIENKIKLARKKKARLLSRSAVFEGNAPEFAIIFEDLDNTPWQDSCNLSFDNWQAYVEKHKAAGWRPDHFYYYGVGAKRLFGAILVKDPNKTDWDVSWSLTPAEFAKEISARKARGFRPLTAIGHEDNAGAQRFSAIWIRYRMPVASDAGAPDKLGAAAIEVAESAIYGRID